MSLKVEHTRTPTFQGLDRLWPSKLFNSLQVFPLAFTAESMGLHKLGTYAQNKYGQYASLNIGKTLLNMGILWYKQRLNKHKLPVLMYAFPLVGLCPLRVLDTARYSYICYGWLKPVYPNL